jgi:hypothetical protein
MQIDNTAPVIQARKPAGLRAFPPFESGEYFDKAVRIAA